jgi:hypothetical protein
VLNDSASGTVTADGTRTAVASAQAAKLGLVGGLITADAPATAGQAREPVTSAERRR